MATTHDAEFWLILKARLGGTGDRRYVYDIATTPRVTKKRPSTIARDECAVKMTVRIPDAVFLRPSLAVEIDVPEEAAIPGTPVAIVATSDGEEIPLS